jgi:AcrR family transcriptional regulator
VTDRYHHGDLRAELLRRAAEVIDRDGAADLTLRGLARQAGVSHAAPRHHFPTRTDLLTALAAEGYRLLGRRLREARAGGDFVEVGVAYVQFATDLPAHFDVMFHPDLLDPQDPDLVAAQQEAFDVLTDGVAAMGATGDAAVAVVAGWSLVHGLATLAATGALEGAHLRDLLPDRDLASVARRAAGMLYGSPEGVAR